MLGSVFAGMPFSRAEHVHRSRFLATGRHPVFAWRNVGPARSWLSEPPQLLKVEAELRFAVRNKRLAILPFRAA